MIGPQRSISVFPFLQNSLFTTISTTSLNRALNALGRGRGAAKCIEGGRNEVVTCKNFEIDFK